jgi:hypothetical protein
MVYEVSYQSKRDAQNPHSKFTHSFFTESESEPDFERVLKAVNKYSGGDFAPATISIEERSEGGSHRTEEAKPICNIGLDSETPRLTLSCVYVQMTGSIKTEELRSFSRVSAKASAHSLRSTQLALQGALRKFIYAELNGLASGVRLIGWQCTSPGPVPGAAITLASSSQNPKAGSLNASTVIAPCADTKSTGPYLAKAMARLTIDQIPVGPMLDTLTAEKIFGWKSVHRHGGSLVGRKRDKAGHWRLAKVPCFSTNFLHAYAIVGRVKDLGRLDRYRQELAKAVRFTKMPSYWASPDQCCRAAIKAVGQYGQVIPLSSRKQIQR